MLPYPKEHGFRPLKYKIKNNLIYKVKEEMEKDLGVYTWDTNSHALFMHSISLCMKYHSVGLSDPILHIKK